MMGRIEEVELDLEAVKNDTALTGFELIAAQIGLLTKAVLLLVKEYRDAHPVWHGGPR